MPKQKQKETTELLAQKKHHVLCDAFDAVGFSLKEFLHQGQIEFVDVSICPYW